MGGRGARSGGGGSAGEVVIRKKPEPNKQGYSYYMTGTRNILSNWDDNGNYHEKPRKIKENVRQRFNTLEEAIKYAKNEKYKYLNL